MARSLWMTAFVVLWLGSPAMAQDGIAWTTNLRAAQETAARDSKLVLVHFYSDNCPPCRALERNVFPRPEVAAAVHLNYVPVKVHVDTAPQLAERFRIEAWPTDLILTPAGLEVTRMVSPKSPADYALMLEQVAFQSGVGAARRSESTSLGARPPSPRNRDISLAAATVPMGQPPNAAPAASLDPAAGSFAPPAPSTAPGRTDLYDPRAATAPTAGAPPVSNPYPGQAAQHRYAPPANPQVPPTSAAPNTAAYLQAAARAAGGRPPQNTVAAAPQTALTPGRSIYDDEPPAQDHMPAPSVYAPPGPTAPLPQLPAPAGSSIYEPSSRPPTQSPAVGRPQLPPPGTQRQPVYQPPVQSPQPGRQASAQFQPLQSIPVDKAPPAAIDGFCPVTILESKRWHKGNVRYGAVHRNRTYLFASEEAQKRFLADPLRYAPVLSGCDPVVFAETNQLIDGNHNIGLLIGGKTYFFTSEETLQRFKLSPQAYIARVNQATAAGQMRTR